MARAIATTRSLVSVVTPFYNTELYLAECIESVLGQTYTEFEYILMDNCSTDDSNDIAAAYASRDPRIRLIRCTEFVSQLANYNRALAEISHASRYCKIVQADDWIFPECLELMVQAFEQSEAIGLVSSYWLDGNQLCGSGLSPRTMMISGRDCARWYLRTGTCLFATQTQVMYRSPVVRANKEFYNVTFPFADLQRHMEILERWDFGFAHQVLSFSRRDNESSLSSLQSFGPSHLLQYIVARRYAGTLFAADEADLIIGKYKREYYRVLARAALRLREPAFWRFHKAGLKALDEHETHDWVYLAMLMGPELLWLAANPGLTALRALRSVRRSKTHTRAARGAGSRTADLVSQANELLDG
jgi:glycosyltransferase involved in cell wall biosynthesis